MKMKRSSEIETESGWSECPNNKNNRKKGGKKLYNQTINNMDISSRFFSSGENKKINWAFFYSFGQQQEQHRKKIKRKR